MVTTWAAVFSAVNCLQMLALHLVSLPVSFKKERCEYLFASKLNRSPSFTSHPWGQRALRQFLHSPNLPMDKAVGRKHGPRQAALLNLVRSGCQGHAEGRILCWLWEFSMASLDLKS